jgi:hypothetical protein
MRALSHAYLSLFYMEFSETEHQQSVNIIPAQSNSQAAVKKVMTRYCPTNTQGPPPSCEMLYQSPPAP